MELEELLVNGNITASCQANMSPKQKIKSYKQQKWTLRKNCLAHKFSKIPKLQNTSIKFVIHASFCISVFFFLFLMFWAIVFMFHSVWWRFPVNFAGSISWHTSSNFPLEAGSNYLLLFKKKKIMSSRFCPCYGKKLGISFHQKFIQGKSVLAYENGVFVHCCHTQNEFSLFQS